MLCCIAGHYCNSELVESSELSESIDRVFLAMAKEQDYQWQRKLYCQVMRVYGITDIVSRGRSDGQELTAEDRGTMIRARDVYLEACDEYRASVTTSPLN